MIFSLTTPIRDHPPSSCHSGASGAEESDRRSIPTARELARARVGELIHANGKRQNAANEGRSLTRRLARFKQQFEWRDIGGTEYPRKRDKIKAALAALNEPGVTEIANAADYMQNMARVWQAATDEEKRDMTRAILEDWVCDPEMRRFIALRPKPAFRLLFRQIRGLAERDGTFEIVGGVEYNSQDAFPP